MVVNSGTNKTFTSAPNSGFAVADVLVDGSSVGAVTTYTFNTHTAQHYFCRVCGIQSFYVPRSNPDGYDVDVRCLDPGTLESYTVIPFDGAHWEQHGAALASLSQERSGMATPPPPREKP